MGWVRERVRHSIFFYLLHFHSLVDIDYRTEVSLRRAEESVMIMRILPFIRPLTQATLEETRRECMSTSHGASSRAARRTLLVGRPLWMSSTATKSSLQPVRIARLVTDNNAD